MIEPIALPPSPALLRLNQADATHLSELDAGRLAQLVRMAFRATRIGASEAMLIAFDQDAAYGSCNFLWFRQRFARFVYVDRVVVALADRGRGHARRLYQDVFAHALAAGHDRVVCEVNAEPPNPASDAFHARMGFTLVGSGDPSPAKRVTYLCRILTGQDGAHA